MPSSLSEGDAAAAGGLRARKDRRAQEGKGRSILTAPIDLPQRTKNCTMCCGLFFLIKMRDFQKITDGHRLRDGLLGSYSF